MVKLTHSRTAISPSKAPPVTTVGRISQAGGRWVQSASLIRNIKPTSKLLLIVMTATVSKHRRYFGPCIMCGQIAHNDKHHSSAWLNNFQNTTDSIVVWRPPTVMWWAFCSCCTCKAKIWVWNSWEMYCTRLWNCQVESYILVME